jgi:hypothetical protein
MSKVSLELEISVQAREPIVISHMGDQNANAALGITDPMIKRARNTVPMTQVVDDAGYAEWTPMIPAGHLRGKLRRLAFEVVIDAILSDPAYGDVYRDQEFPFHIQDYLLMVLGGTELDARDRTALTLPRRQRRANPMIGLWGAAKPILQSAAQCGHLYAQQGPSAITTVPGGHRKLDFLHDPDFAARFPADDRAAVSRAQEAVAKRSRLEAERDRLKRDRPKLEKQQKSTQEIDARLNEIERELHDLQADAEELSGNTIERPLDDVFAAAKGTIYRGHFQLPAALPAEAGLLFAALARFAAAPRLGGMAARNLGWIDFTARLYERDKYGGRHPAGQIAFGDPEGPNHGGWRLTDPGPQVQAAMDAWDAIARTPLNATNAGEPIRWHRHEIDAMSQEAA